MDDRILEPTESYHKYYADEFRQNAENHFEELVKQSGVDVEENRRLAASYRDKLAQSSTLAKKCGRLKTLRTMLSIIAALALIFALVGVMGLIKNTAITKNVLFLVLGGAIGIGIIVLIIKVMRPRLKNAKLQKSTLDNEAENLLTEAWKQMAPLNALFETTDTKNLIEKTVPLLKIDDNFNMRRYDYLNGKYGFGEHTAQNRSTIGILTGEILGNPFVVQRDMVQNMGTCDYSGSIVITWTTTVRDSNGNVHTQVHTETLVATVTKPKPYYSEQTTLIYGNDAAPDLTFTHSPSHAEMRDEKQLAKMVKSGSKKIQKLQEKSTKEGGNFTGMGNETFDALFGATDRNNEVQFRLLFTPLGQQNMVKLMTDKQAYGDDFTFCKDKCLNYVSSEHSAVWDMNTSYTRYRSYDVDAAKSTFVNFNCNYFKSLYFDLAPLLSIPLYQQQKPREYIYKDTYLRNCTDYETEFIANTLGTNHFAPQNAKTQSILKTKLTGKYNDCDGVQVTAYAFDTVQHTEYVTKLGGDGNLHNVPVVWLEYVPIERSSNVKVAPLDVSDKTYLNKFAGKTDAAFGSGQAFAHNILCCINSNASLQTFCEKLDETFKNSK